MTTEHDLAHGRAAPRAPSLADDDLMPGRGTRSSQLAAPSHPIAGGLLLRKARDANGVADDAEQAVAAAASSAGHPLPGPILRKFESSLGADLSSVRVHTSAESQAATESVGAKAYTVGQDIHFGAGQYDPASSTGEHLLAHEVAHTVQQRGGTAMRQHKLEVSTPADHLEREADRAADAMLAGFEAQVAASSGLSRAILREKAGDPDTKALPRDPAFVAPDGSFGVMVTAIESSMKGGAGAVASPDSAFSASEHNLNEAIRHAHSSQMYYGTHTSSTDPGNLNAALGNVANADATLAIDMLADLGRARSATNSWVGLVNGSNTAWSTLASVADKMCIDVHQKVEPAGLAALGGGSSTKLGDQTISADDVGGAGMGLAVSAKRAGTIGGPDTTSYKKAMADYNAARDNLIPKERRIIETVNAAKQAAIQKKMDAATEEKAEWEALAQATDAFAIGITAAVGGAALVEGEIGAATISDPGGANVVVNQVGDKKVAGVMDNSQNSIVSTKPPELGKIAEQSHSFLSKAIDIKITKINQRIALYDQQISQYKKAQETQNAKANMEEYLNALADLRRKAKDAEDAQADMEKKMIEWGQKVDADLIKQGKATKGSTDNAEAAQLLAKIRTASVATDGAIQGLTSAVSLPALYSALADAAKQRMASEAGRSDKRYQVFVYESNRWTVAASATGAASAALQRRQAQLQALETSFLSTFAQYGATNPAGSQISANY
jgi:hypothetical protein